MRERAGVKQPSQFQYQLLAVGAHVESPPCGSLLLGSLLGGLNPSLVLLLLDLLILGHDKAHQHETHLIGRDHSWTKLPSCEGTTGCGQAWGGGMVAGITGSGCAVSCSCSWQQAGCCGRGWRGFGANPSRVAALVAVGAANRLLATHKHPPHRCVIPPFLFRHTTVHNTIHGTS